MQIIISLKCILHFKLNTVYVCDFTSRLTQSEGFRFTRVICYVIVRKYRATTHKQL